MNETAQKKKIIRAKLRDFSSQSSGSVEDIFEHYVTQIERILGISRDVFLSRRNGTKQFHLTYKYLLAYLLHVVHGFPRISFFKMLRYGENSTAYWASTKVEEIVDGVNLSKREEDILERLLIVTHMEPYFNPVASSKESLLEDLKGSFNAILLGSGQSPISEKEEAAIKEIISNYKISLKQFQS